MSWSFPIGRLFGSEVRVHVTFFLLLAWIAIAHYQQGGTAAAVNGVLFIIAIFACVVAHEFGHALTARRYGIRTPDITLLPIGGLARLERMPEKPREEIIVALAGPAVNVVIAAVLILFLNAKFDLSALERLDNPGLSFMVRLASVNVFLVLFNLIPAFPMDGGRVLRALLAIWYPRTQATNIAARIGQALAFGFGFIGLMTGNALLIFIAIFVYLAATAEAQSVGLQDVSRHLGVRDGMITRFELLGPQADDRRRGGAAPQDHAARVPGDRRSREAPGLPHPQHHGPGALKERRRHLSDRRDGRRHPHGHGHGAAGGGADAHAGAQRPGRRRGRRGGPPRRLRHAGKHRRADDGRKCRSRAHAAPPDRAAAAAIAAALNPSFESGA